MPFMQIRDLELYYEIHGDGPPLLNISGTGGDLRRMPVGRLPFNDHFTVLSYDQRGLGQTAKPDRSYSMADYADDAAALIEARGWSSCHVIGTSFGGMVALNLAARHGELIDRLVLCCTSPGGSVASYPLHELETLGPAEALEKRMGLLDNRWDADSDPAIPDLPASFLEMMRMRDSAELDPATVLGQQRQLAARAGHDVTDALGDLDMDALVCAGRYDELAPLSNSQYLVDHMPRARLAVFEGGHVFMFQDRTAYPTIIDFLASGSS